MEDSIQRAQIAQNRSKEAVFGENSKCGKMLPSAEKFRRGVIIERVQCSEGRYMFIRSVNVTDEAEPLNEPPTAILVIRLWVLFVVQHVWIVKLARFAELVELLIVHVVDRAVWAYPRVRDWRQRGVLHPRGFDFFEVEFFSRFVQSSP